MGMFFLIASTEEVHGSAGAPWPWAGLFRDRPGGVMGTVASRTTGVGLSRSLSVPTSTALGTLLPILMESWCHGHHHR